MNIKNLPMVQIGKNILTPIGNYYLTHQSTFLMGTQIVLSIATPALLAANARKILGIIDDTRIALERAETVNERNDIYGEALKALTPLVTPIIALEVLQIVVAIKQKKSIDSKDKTIGELTESLAVANNAIVSYQLFKKEAEEKMTAKKLEEVQNAVAKELVEKDPPTFKNSMNKVEDCVCEANERYHYYDVLGKRYFWSSKAPSDIKIGINNLSIALSKGETSFDRSGLATVTVNDVYYMIDPVLVVHPHGDIYGWHQDDTCGRAGRVDEGLINCSVYCTEDPNDSDHPIWIIDIEGEAFFRD